jgi:hypothetical protein
VTLELEGPPLPDLTAPNATTEKVTLHIVALQPELNS